MNNFLIENELGYTNHYNGKYITEDNATHVAVYVDGALVIKEYELAEVSVKGVHEMINPEQLVKMLKK